MSKGHKHRVYARPDDSRVNTRHGKRMEFIKNQREEVRPVLGPIRSCKCMKGGKLCGNLFRSVDHDEQFCSECLYRLYVVPDWGSRSVTVHHPNYD